LRNKASRSGKLGSSLANEWVTVAFAYLALVSLAAGSWPYLTGSSSASPNNFVPFALSLAVYFVLKAWPLLFDDVSTIVGLVVLAAGFIAFYAGFRSPDASQKSDFKDLGLGLIGMGIGVLVGQRLPMSTKRINDDNAEDDKGNA
jgi:hypothetical protein